MLRPPIGFIGAAHSDWWLMLGSSEVCVAGTALWNSSVAPGQHTRSGVAFRVGGDSLKR